MFCFKLSKITAQTYALKLTSEEERMSRTQIPYILESNPHPFYSFSGLKNQMQIIIACGLDSRSRAGFWKNDRAAVRSIRTTQYNNLLFYLLLIIIIYYSSDSPSSLITESLSVLPTQSLSSLSSTLSSHTMSLPNNFTFELCHIWESFRFLASLFHN